MLYCETIKIVVVMPSIKFDQWFHIYLLGGRKFISRKKINNEILDELKQDGDGNEELVLEYLNMLEKHKIGFFCNRSEDSVKRIKQEFQQMDKVEIYIKK